jgi:hypothetical protein
MKAALTTCMLIALCLAWPVQGANEDFGTWDETDALGYLTVGDNDVVVSTMPTKVTATVSKDFGADYWADDFTVTLEFTGGTCSHTTAANVLGVFGLSNIEDATWTSMFFDQGVLVRWTRDADGHMLLLEAHNYPDHVFFHDPNALNVSTKYYVTLTFDADGGDSGLGLYTMYVCTGNYQGSGGVLVDTQTLHITTGYETGFQYASTAFSRTNGSATVTQSGTIENIDVSGYTPEAPAEVPDKVTTPSPAHQATGVTVTPTLTWAAADGAINYNVYFGQGELVLIGNQATRTYTPAELDPNGTEYWWRIDANNAEGATTGDTWTFTTAYEYTGGDYGTTEDFNYWTVVDSQSQIGVTDANTITASTLVMNHGAYAYRHMGAEYFDGDVTIRFQAEITDATNNGTLGLLSLSDLAGSYMDWYWQAADAQAVYVKSESGSLNCHLAVWDDGAVDSNSTELSLDTPYFFQFERDDDGGDNSTGLLTLYITTTAYHGEGGAVAVDTVLFDVPASEQNDFDYAITAFSKSNHGDLATISGTISYLDLGAVTTPSYDPPAKATVSYPSDGATGISTAATLSWNASANATNYNVYFGTPGDLSLIGNQTTRSYTPTGMEDANEYAWRIDPNNAYGTTQGDEWTFTTGSTTSTTGELSSVTQHGITWTFDTTYTVGQFANGDFYVVGPVTITNISPRGATQNGTMVNPVSNTAQGFDSRSNYWSASTNIADDLPYTVPVNSSVISSRSLSAESSASYVGYCAVLTVLASAPSDGSFRPSYFGTDKTIKHNTSQLNYSLLYGLTPTANAPTPMAAAEWFEGPWIDFGAGWSGRTFHPAAQMPPYGRDLSARIGSGALALHLNYTDEQKADLMIRFTQLGIDNYGIVSHPAGRTTWDADGGHCMGRKFPILFAGAVLGDQNMLGIGDKSGAYLWSAKSGGGFYGPGDVPPDYMYFQEDMQTFFIDQFMVDLDIEVAIDGYARGGTSTTITVDGLPRWRGQPEGQYVEILSGPGAGQRRYVSSSNYQRTNYPEDPVILTVSEAWTTTPTTQSYYELQGYDSTNIGVAEWGDRHALNPRISHPSWGADYRWINGVAYTGWILAARIMDLEPQWNHEALFAYQDRWMDTTDRTSWDAWQDEMWAAYRDNLPDAPTTAPTVPTNPVPADDATDVAPSVTLRWDGQATTWTVYVGTSSDALVYQGETTIRQYAPTLDYSETYYWQIAAENAYGSSLSPIWSFTTESETIAAPGTPGLQTPADAATNQPTSLTLRWGATANTTRYNVWFGVEGSMTVVATPLSSSYAASGLANDTTYEWRIEAVGPGGVASSSTRTFTTVAAGGTPSDPDPGGPSLPDLPAATTQTRAPQLELRRTRSENGLIAEPVEFDDGQPTTKATRSTLSGYLERIVIYTVGTDTLWSLAIKDAWGGELFSADDLDMTEGTVAYDGQRLPFIGGLQVTVDGTTTDTAEEIWVILLVDEAYRTRD